MPVHLMNVNTERFHANAVKAEASATSKFDNGFINDR